MQAQLHRSPVTATSAMLVAVSVALAGCSDSATSGPPPVSHAQQHGVEVKLEPATAGDVTLELAQGHGPLTPGGVGHLAIRLPYSDDGQTKIRVWIGGQDSAGTTVADAIYVPPRDYYDVHMPTPDPLPQDALWWIEVEKPDGTKALASAQPRTQ
ncbi:MAG: hypothetical protein AAF823_10890 [Planctomycetota bacterium]